jgi:hypothetical protein
MWALVQFESGQNSISIAIPSNPNAPSKQKRDAPTSLLLKNLIAITQLTIPITTATLPTTITRARDIGEFQFIFSLTVDDEN